MNYNQFIESKKSTIAPSGYSVNRDGLNQGLFEFQKDIVKWALRRGRAAIFAGTGLGKSRMQIEWGMNIHRLSGGDVLILAPLAVASQTVREGAALGYAVNLCRTQDDVKPGLNITNYEMLHHFEPLFFSGVVLDECFPGNTLIDTVIDDQTAQKPICEIKPGDLILNASGVDKVADVHRREVKYAIKITIEGRPIICSPNHPLFTQRGWVGAQDIVPGDRVMQTAEAMRMVRNGFYTQILGAGEATLLRDILLSEMANEPTGAQGKNPQPRSGRQKGQKEISLAEIREPGSSQRSRTDQEIKSYVKTGSKRESLPPIEVHEPQTFRAWGQWDWFNSATEDFTGCSWRRLDSGVCFVTGKADSGLSLALQARLSKSRAESRHRGGWKLPLCSEVSGRKEGYKIGFSWVESLEVLEQGHPELEQFREQDGRIYFYDLGATRHPSFSINGLLVHNSSILKAFTGKMRTELIESFAHTPYRLACTATPAPNDYMEIGNHAEFLGVMSRTEMLSMYFVHDGGDTSKWRLKGPAEKEFWAWVASWAVVLEKPSDLGYEDGAFQLPPLRMHEIIVPAEGPPAKTMTERRQARKNSLGARVEKCAELVNQTDDIWLVWCDLNDESDALTKSIDGSVEVRGSHKPSYKENAALDFATGSIKRLVSKSSIFGFGLNFQLCNKMAFVGLSDSFEQMFQAVRRCWRFGQTEPVDVYIITAETEGAVLENIKRKEQDFRNMVDEMVKYTQGILSESIRATERDVTEYEAQRTLIIPEWLRSEQIAS